MSGLELPRPLDWMSDARCVETDPEAFFPSTGNSGAAAKRVCRVCPVRDECLAWALETGEPHGVLGGASAEDRRRMRRRAARRATPSIEHGTERGAQAHRRRSEVPCGPCSAARSSAQALRAGRDVCPVCGDEMLRSSLPRHVVRRHPDAADAA